MTATARPPGAGRGVPMAPVRARLLLVAIVVGATALAGWRVAQRPAAPSTFAAPVAEQAQPPGPTATPAAATPAPAHAPGDAGSAAADAAAGPRFLPRGTGPSGRVVLDDRPPAPPPRSVSAQAGAAVHAASGVRLRDGRLRAFWFSGSREGAPDVEIRTAVFDPGAGRWSVEATALTRAQVARGLARSVRKLGNPVAVRASDGRLHLYVVTVSVGGWAGSAINRFVSDDEGATWHSGRRLVTSPFANLGTLVKGTPLALAGGQVGLPVYHELVTRFPEWLRLDAEGRVLDRVRLPGSEFSLQPVVLAADDRHAVAFMRHASPRPPQRVTMASTSDAGRTWSTVTLTDLPNPNAAVAVLATRAGDWWMVFNDSEADRGNLSLAWARAPAPGEAPVWVHAAVLDGDPTTPAALPADRYRDDLATAAAATPDARGPTSTDDARAVAEAAARQLCFPTPTGTACNREYSYPSLVEGADGSVHVLYTWHRARIAHQVLPPDWLETRRVVTAVPLGVSR